MGSILDIFHMLLAKMDHDMLLLVSDIGMLFLWTT
jgi:hypothetical protein